MKKLIISTAVLGLFTLGATAQRVNDPTYSSHNYKHPNKAAYMKRIEQEKPVVYLEEVDAVSNANENSLTASSNYKGMQPFEAKIKRFRATTAPEAAPYFVDRTSTGNYKQQFSPRTKPVIQENRNTNVDVVASK